MGNSIVTTDLSNNAVTLNKVANATTTYQFVTSSSTSALIYKNINNNTDFNLWFNSSNGTLIDVNKINRNNGGLASNTPYVIISLANG